jgi:hypothetical protein
MGKCASLPNWRRPQISGNYEKYAAMLRNFNPGKSDLKLAWGGPFGLYKKKRSPAGEGWETALCDLSGKPEAGERVLAASRRGPSPAVRV